MQEAGGDARGKGGPQTGHKWEAPKARHGPIGGGMERQVSEVETTKVMGLR